MNTLHQLIAMEVFPSLITDSNKSCTKTLKIGNQGLEVCVDIQSIQFISQIVMFCNFC
jgi:hypothetical protein